MSAFDQIKDPDNIKARMNTLAGSVSRTTRFFDRVPNPQVEKTLIERKLIHFRSLEARLVELVGEDATREFVAEADLYYHHHGTEEV